MAAPPPAYSTPHAGNPDRRALPDGWITRYDDNYRAWYYVDTRAHPPRSAWDHPLGPPPANPPANFAPPPHPPPTRTGSYNTGGTPSAPFSSSPPQPNQPYSVPYSPSSSGGYPGYPGTPHDPRALQQQAPFQTQQQQPTYGSPNYGNPGNPAWPQQSWQQQPPTQFGYQTQPPSQTIQQPPRSGRNHGGVGMGTAIAAGGAGLLGGALLANAIEGHDDREREEGYDQGFMDGRDGAGFDDDIGGGGDW